jgi:hypothetical protein
MNHWTTKGEAAKDSSKKKQLSDQFKSEIMDTRIVVSNIFSNFRISKDKNYSKDCSPVPSAKKK